MREQSSWAPGSARLGLLDSYSSRVVGVDAAVKGLMQEDVDARRRWRRRTWRKRTWRKKTAVWNLEIHGLAPKEEGCSPVHSTVSFVLPALVLSEVRKYFSAPHPPYYSYE